MTLDSEILIGMSVLAAVLVLLAKLRVGSSAMSFLPRPTPQALFDPGRIDGDGFPWCKNDQLSKLRFVVFDTETTGLKPGRGDELVQLAAVRIDNGELNLAASLDQLVNPGRAIPASSTLIHGITDEMVADEASVTETLGVFHRFAVDTILVAHCAQFDMAFLTRDQRTHGLIFNQPVLDTMLLAYALDPHSRGLSLDAVAQRFGVEIHGRHTAMGDARATAEIFLRMLPALASIRVMTLGDAVSACQRMAELLHLRG